MNRHFPFPWKPNSGMRSACIVDDFVYFKFKFNLISLDCQALVLAAIPKLCFGGGQIVWCWFSGHQWSSKAVGWITVYVVTTIPETIVEIGSTGIETTGIGIGTETGTETESIAIEVIAVKKGVITEAGVIGGSEEIIQREASIGVTGMIETGVVIEVNIKEGDLVPTERAIRIPQRRKVRKMSFPMTDPSLSNFKSKWRTLQLPRLRKRKLALQQNSRQWKKRKIRKLFRSWSLVN